MYSANKVEKLHKNSTHFGESGEIEHPLSLQNICLNYLCINLNEICVKKTVVVSPKRRRVHSGSNQLYVDLVDSSDNSSPPSSTASYLNSRSKGDETPVGGLAVLVSPNLKPILPCFSEDYFEADSPKKRPDSSTEGMPMNKGVWE